MELGYPEAGQLFWESAAEPMARWVDGIELMVLHHPHVLLLGMTLIRLPEGFRRGPTYTADWLRQALVESDLQTCVSKRRAPLRHA